MNSKINKGNLILEIKKAGFTIVELIIAIGMMSILSGLMLPSFLNWIRTEKVNSYTRELKEYFRVVRLNSRRWGTSCSIDTNLIQYNSVQKDKNYYGYTVLCSDNTTTINSLAPAINNSIFQVTNKNFRVTPNGRISSDGSIVIVIGSKYFNSGSSMLNCLVIQSPTGHITKGKFTDSEWVESQMAVSQIDTNNILSPDKCKSS